MGEEKRDYKYARLRNGGIIVALLILSFVNIVSANPGIVVTVEPGSLDAIVGQTVSYQVRIESISDIEEHVQLSVPDQVSGWGYDFDTPSFDLPAGDFFITNLHVSVPASSSPGTYTSNVLGTASIPGFEDFVTGTSFFTFITNVSIPEFPNIATPVAAVIGLVYVFGWNRKKNS